LLIAALAAGAFSALPGAVGVAAAQQQTLSFDIREQSLSAALVEFSRRSGIVVVAPAHLLAGKRAPAVRGVFTPDAALGRLLARSGLEPRRRPEGGLTLVAAAAPPAGASQNAARAPAPAPVVNEPPLVVTGQRLAQFTFDYATALAGAAPGTDQIPRWNTQLCVSVAGLDPAAAQAVIDHIARRAHEVGLRAEHAGCQPNIVIVFAEDSDTIARRIVETRRDLLGYLFSEETITAGREALDEFANTPRPVRWWHVARRTMADGQPLSDSGASLNGPSTSNNAAAGSLPNAVGLPAGAHVGSFRGVDSVRSQATRVRSNTRQDLNFVLIIVDSRRVAGVSPQAMSDYLAMTTLAPISPHADLSELDSVLNLFAQRREDASPAAEMTIWDSAYLQGLYTARPDAASLRQHNADIARRMAEQIQSISNGETP
jgi:hypothetical protein